MSTGSLFTAISGLRNHQTRMEVIGNNLANINTAGYKKSRVTFSEMFSRTLSVGQAPTDVSGGVNPMQIGTGAHLASVDTLHTQGSFQTTGNPTDLSINGSGFFVLRNTEAPNTSGNGSIVFTRAGNFNVDSDGTFIYAPNGFKVQGWMTDGTGQVNSSSSPADIKLPLGEKIARATQEVLYGGNLDARAGSATVVSGATETGIQAISMPGLNNVSLGEHQITVTAATAPAQGFVASIGDGQTVPIVTGQTLTLVPAVSGETLQVNLGGLTENGTATLQVSNGTISVLNASTSELFNQLSAVNAFTLPAGSNLADGIHTLAVETGAQGGLVASLDDGPSVSATGNVTLTRGDTSQAFQVRFDEAPTAIGEITVQIDPIHSTVSGIGTTGLDNTDDVSVSVPPVSTLGTGRQVITITDLGNGIFGASLNGGPVVNVLPNGTYTLEGGTLGGRQTGGSIEISFGPQIQSGAVEIDTIGRSRNVSMTVYDSLGEAHDLGMAFTKIAENKWKWEVTSISNTEPGTEISGFGGLVVAPATGKVNISPPLETITFTPAGGAESAEIQVDTRMFEGITQLATDFDVAGISQDGLSAGALDSFRIDESGNIVGIFTNGISRVVAQLALAEIANTGGLERIGDTTFATSLSSGTAVYGTAGRSGIGSVEAGTLEMSNVDLTEEFTDMIIAERGFQANSRVITTTDELLVEALGLKR